MVRATSKGIIKLQNNAPKTVILIIDTIHK